MGAEPWFYVVPYQPNINLALNALREREFAAGRYYPAIALQEFPVTATAPSPGPRHSSIEEAVQAADECGTRSILDMMSVGSTSGNGVVTPLSPLRLVELFGTERPSLSMVESNTDFFCDIARGQGIYIVVYADDNPQQILFAGYSYD